jgi:hypothetical protein
MRRRPLRFLALALGGWVLVRAAVLIPWSWSEAVVNALPNVVQSLPSATGPAVAEAAAPAPSRMAPGLTRNAPCKARSMPSRPAVSEAPVPARPVAAEFANALDSRAVLPGDQPRSFQPAAGRWAASAWLLIRRDGGGPGLAPGGSLGGSQAGARVAYRLGGGVSLSGRAYVPLRRPAGAEVAAGMDWRPIAAIPASILAERRQAIGREGRSAFSITAYGGASQVLAGRLRLDGYGQAGIVGLRSRDPFVEGAVRVAAPVGPIELGAGLRGAAQPGASRLDAGPILSYRLPIRGARLRVEADWRFRVAGDAAPGSGPALTLAADF